MMVAQGQVSRQQQLVKWHPRNKNSVSIVVKVTVQNSEFELFDVYEGKGMRLLKSGWVAGSIGEWSML